MSDVIAPITDEERREVLDAIENLPGHIAPGWYENKLFRVILAYEARLKGTMDDNTCVAVWWRYETTRGHEERYDVPAYVLTKVPPIPPCKLVPIAAQISNATWVPMWVRQQALRPREVPPG